MKLITHSMHWGWKVAFMLGLLPLINFLGGLSYYPEQNLAVLAPLLVWITARWIVIGNQAKEG